MNLCYRKLPREFEENEQDNYRLAVKCFVSGLPLPAFLLYAIFQTPLDQLLQPLNQTPLLFLLLFIFFSYFIALPLIVTGHGVSQIVLGVRIRAAKRAWVASAAHTRLHIVDRNEEYNSYGQTNEETWVTKLAVRLPQEPALHSEVLIAWADVSGGVFAQYKNKDFVPAYYNATNILEFVIKGEW